jgi:2,4-dichlorophenol 6-monooxygenase
MEISRDLGIEDQVTADAAPHELVGDTIFCTSIAGEEIGGIRTWGTHPATTWRGSVRSSRTACS